MAFGRLDIILGADVRGLETALGTAETVTNRLQKKFEETAAKSVSLGTTMTLVSARIGTSMRLISQSINGLSSSKFTEEQNKIINKVQETVEKLSNVSDAVTTASTIFSTFAAVGSRAIATISARVPALAGALNAMLGPWGLIATVAIAAATAIGFSWANANKEIRESERITKSLAQVQREASDSVVPQIAKVTQLTAVVKDNTAGYKERLNALNQLKGISPSYFGDLTIEKDKIDSINLSLKSYVANLEKTATVKVLQKDIDSDVEKLISKKKQLDAAFTTNSLELIAPLTQDIAFLESAIEKSVKQASEISKGLVIEGPKIIPDKSIDLVAQTVRNVRNELANTNFSVGSGFTDELAGVNQNINTLQNGLVRLAALGVKPDNKVVQEFKAQLTDLNNLVPSLSIKDILSKIEVEAAQSQTNIELGVTTDTEAIQSSIRSISSALVDIASLQIDVDDTALVSLRDNAIQSLQTKLSGLKDEAKNLGLSEAFEKAFASIQSQFDNIDLGFATPLEANTAAINSTRKAIQDLVAEGARLDDSRVIALSEALQTLEEKGKALTIADTLQQINDKLAQTDNQLFAGIISESDAASTKVNAIKNALINLINQGVDPADAEFQKLLSTMRQLGADGGDIFKGLAQKTQVFAGIASQALGALSTFQDNALERRAIELEGYYNREKEFIEASYLPNVLKAKKIEELEKKLSKEKRKIQRDEAVGNKRKSVFESIINTAVGVTKALASAEPPRNFILAGIVGALGVAQTAAIASAPIPQLAKGGIAFGETLVNVGEYSGSKSNPEVIAPLDRLTDIIRASLGDINTGGVNGNVVLSSVIRGDDIYQIGVLQDEKSKRIR